MAGLRRNQLQTIFTALILTFLLAFTGMAQQARAQGVDQRLIARARQISGDSFPFQTRTERGVRVLARTRPRPEMLSAIDNGLAELFAVARRHGYNSRLDYSAYIVFIARADRERDSQGNYSPDVAVPAGQYAGGYYDQGGFIYAAGMVLAYNPCAFVIAEHDRDFQRMANVVRYEGEHIVLYYNDRALFQQTRDHSRGGSHPILQ
ncbi:MAG TPA: hypothetical protein VK619_17300 [Pyrinomonadaceae bacterium]|nr:hypothetical protein [Pyrinomonadaceae bacterium]